MSLKMGKQSNAWPVHKEYRQLISEEDTFLWLQRGELKAETECEITAAQDQALQTKYHATRYYKQKLQMHTMSTI